ncbi:MAG TPA: hypothetical protein VHB46_09055 [Burkholderiales bacterium]|nr:hypothetical protein [Burkholderiales bacterium]
MFIADSGSATVVSFANPNPVAGTLRIDRTLSGTAISNIMPDMAYDAAADMLYVVNNRSIMVMNRASTKNGSNAPDRTITSSSIPSTIVAIYLDTVKNILYVTYGSSTVLAFDNASTLNGSFVANRTLTINRSAVGVPVKDVFVDTVHDTLYVAGHVGSGGVNDVVLKYNSASTIPTGTPTIDHELTFPDTINDIVGDGANDRLFIADQSANSVLVFDSVSTLSGAVVAPRVISLPSLPQRLALAPVGNRLYALASGITDVYVVNNASTATTGAPVTTLTSSSAGSFSAIATAP